MNLSLIKTLLLSTKCEYIHTQRLAFFSRECLPRRFIKAAATETSIFFIIEKHPIGIQDASLSRRMYHRSLIVRLSRSMGITSAAEKKKISESTLNDNRRRHVASGLFKSIIDAPSADSAAAGCLLARASKSLPLTFYIRQRNVSTM